MFQFILILLGLLSSGEKSNTIGRQSSCNNTSYINQTSTAVQYNTDFNEDIDTSGETTQTPPKK
ncbi:hypothetical protein DRF65_17525 [Chryseobacterium pennae]|uniref:Uncharacterized protein n=1 Tax=Chryseobacterium pennae TaxID=2258962 RepID=A0A3D9C5B8_9FLAO|nr:hypothetical protein [Chryseobacterium pennae]REC61065.1 hypothetical protein DRF65_17525 [Chryseobacterium pennae]